jgi:hypothetical protein
LLSYAGVRRCDLEASTDRLSEDRLAGVLKLLQSASPEAQTMKLFRGGAQQTSVAGLSLYPDALASAHGGSVPVVPAPVVPVPVVPVPVVPVPVVLAPVVLAPAILAPAVLGRGRHRSQAPWKLAILKVPVALRTVGVRARRFAVTGALVALAAVTIVLVVLKAWVLAGVSGLFGS